MLPVPEASSLTTLSSQLAEGIRRLTQADPGGRAEMPPETVVRRRIGHVFTKATVSNEWSLMTKRGDVVSVAEEREFLRRRLAGEIDMVVSFGIEIEAVAVRLVPGDHDQCPAVALLAVKLAGGESRFAMSRLGEVACPSHLAGWLNQGDDGICSTPVPVGFTRTEMLRTMWSIEMDKKPCN